MKFNLMAGILLSILTVILLVIISMKKIKGKNEIHYRFNRFLLLLAIPFISLPLQIIFEDIINPIYFDYVTYIFTFYGPIELLFATRLYKDSKADNKKLKFLYIISTVLLILLWTNDLHYSFYEVYSTKFSETIYGPIFYIATIYCYIIIILSMIITLISSIRRSGFFSAQSLIIIFGVLVPVVGNILGVTKIINMTIYITPILLATTAICFYIAIVKMKALNVIPVAVKTIMDTMTDSFIVISKDGTIADINRTCIEKFAPLMELKQNDNLYEKLEGRKTVKLADIKALVKEANDKKGTVTSEFHVVKGDYDKYFEIDVQPIKAKSGNEYVASLLLIRDITQAKRDMEIMTKNENLVILGELAGGVAHDINTPIAAIKNGIMMLKDTVATDNEKMLLTRMDSCADKIINLVNSMRNQIRNIGSDEKTEVNISSVINDTLMIVHNETMKKGVKINLNIKDELKVMGNATKLGQVITNLIMNAIQAYENNPGMIDVDVYKSDKNQAMIIVEDYAGGIPEHIRPHIFKNILTTKGVSGTGFGLYLAYSVIKGAFGGDMHFETETGKGTKFVISIPLK